MITSLSQPIHFAGPKPSLTVRVSFLIILVSMGVQSAGGFISFGSSKNSSHQDKTKPQATESEVRELKLGEPIERELVGGEAHAYSVGLTAGQYFLAIVEQKGIDVIVRLFGPDGKKISDVDSPNGTQGPEPVSFIADVSGEYRLEVLSGSKNALPGKYEIRLKEQRIPLPRDRQRMAAERAAIEAEQLRQRGTAESQRQAIAKYGDAIVSFHAIEERSGEANALNDSARIYAQLGEYEKALDLHNQALSVFRELNNRTGEAAALHNIGVAYYQLRENHKALEYLNQALLLWRAEGDRGREATALSDIALSTSQLGNNDDAIRLYKEAIAIQSALRLHQQEATTLYNIAATYVRLGDFEKALEYLTQALDLKRASGDRRGEAYALDAVGGVYNQLGEFQKALRHHQQALLLARETGERVVEYSALNNLGTVHWREREQQKALESYDQALTVARAIKDRRGEAVVLVNIGNVYRESAKPEEALQRYQAALILQRIIGDRRNEALTLYQVGKSYASLHQFEDGSKYLKEALVLNRAVGDRVSEAATRQGIAQVECDRGDLNEARIQVEKAIDIFESTRASLMSQQLRTSFLASRQSIYELYIDILMRMHAAEPLSRYDALALHASERARARSLLETLNESRTDIRQGIDPLLLERERSSQQQLNAASERLTRLLSGKHTKEQEAAPRKEVENLLADYQDVQAQIRSKSPRYAALTQPEPLGSKEIQQLLDEDTLLLEYALGEERSYLWAVTRTSVKSFELPKRTEIETAARSVYEALTARNKMVRFEPKEIREARIAKADLECPRAAAVLSQILLGPIASQLGRQRLLIVSEGALQYVPFGALPAPPTRTEEASKTREPQPLSLSHEIVSLPSASTLGLLRQEFAGRPPATKTLTVFGDPVFREDDPRVKRSVTRSGQEDPLSDPSKDSNTISFLERVLRETGEANLQRLPYTRLEANEIVAFARAGMKRELLDFDASRGAVISGDLTNYRIIHFATHGFIDSQHPELSGVILSLFDQQGNPQNGFLRLNEIYNLKINADLVVLSACRTALGKDIKGEGLIGLTRGFMYAGAPRVVATLWAVEDAATADLMKRFYRELLVRKQRPAAALRTAQLSLWKEKRLPPYYWAGFVLQGDWK